MTTLDGVERTFDSEAVLVCDRNGPSGIAGIMGGQVSEVSDETTRVLLEVATWNGTNILRTSSRLGLRSEASTRFEKQLHPHLAMRAQALASALIVELCGARLVPGQITVDAGEARVDEIGPAPHEWPEREVVELRTARANGLLGMEIPVAEQTEYLERLGFGVEAADGSLRASVPPDRADDVTREADLIEEVARVHGIDEHLPATMPSQSGRVGGLSPAQRLLRRAEDHLRDLGFAQVATWAFVDPALAARLRLAEDDPRASGAVIHNPLSEVGSVMRTTLLGGLLEAARYNRAREASAVALFESGRVFLTEPVTDEHAILDGGFVGARRPPLREPHRFAALADGALSPAGWRQEGRPADFFDLKGVLESLCRGLGAALALEPAPQPFLHPARAARVVIGEREAGWIGELHPLVAREWDLTAPVAFEIDAGPLAAASPAGQEAFEDVTSFPSVYEDLAVVVDDDVSAEAVRAVVVEGGGELLRSARVFDVYRGEQLGEGRKSLALRLEFGAADRTLTAEEVAAQRESITAAAAAIGGVIRG
jgi:phenylalanyl-tRNA synthetase beta chain